MKMSENEIHSVTSTETHASTNEIGLQFYRIQGIDANGDVLTHPGVGYRIYDNFEESYDFCSFNSLEEMAEAINPDTVIPYIIEHFPGHNADRVTLRKHGCTLNGEFIDAATFNHKHYPMYVMPSVMSGNDLATVPVEAGTLVAAIFREGEGGGTIALRLRESAQIQYKGTVYSTPSKYPAALFRPYVGDDPGNSEMKVLKKNIFVVNRETDTMVTTLKTIKDNQIPKASELFDFLFAFIDNDA